MYYVDLVQIVRSQFANLLIHKFTNSSLRSLRKIFAKDLCERSLRSLRLVISYLIKRNDHSVPQGKNEFHSVEKCKN